MSLLDNLEHTVDLKRPVVVTDAAGAQRQTLSTRSSGVSAWVQNASMNERAAFDKIDKKITHKVFFTTDRGLLPGDYIVPTDAPFADAQLIVRADAERSAGKNVLFGVFVELEPNTVPTSYL